jgi:hypothetical protein
MAVLRNCCLFALALAFCSRPAINTPHEPWSRDAVMNYLKKGDCRPALRYLQRVPEGERSVEWYDYLSQTHLVCGENDPTGREDRLSVDVISEALRRYPDSARLLKSRGERQQSIGDAAGASASFAAAREAALRHQRAGQHSTDDEMVLIEFETEGKQRRP